MAAEHRITGARLVGRYTLLGIVAFLTLFPIYTTLVAAFKPGDKVLVNPLVPDSFTLEPIMNAWSDGNLGRYLFNSFVVAMIVTIAQVATSLLSGYAFAMLDFPGRTVLFVAFLATLLVPIEATLVVNRRTVDGLDWLNTYQGLAVPFLATAFGTFLVRQALMAVPGELRDAARIDGAGHLAFLRYVALPVIVPTVGALALFSFLSSWNQYLWPNLITTEESMNTVQSGLTLLRRSSIDEPNALMAGTVIAAVPIFVALLLFQRSLVRGLTSGAVKG
ncbi:carbohydrate ABC transporter membrane protein 2 (CUT1 family) [Ilumatobacter fluminis]|uniref:Carbohydrate ABC transporter membrane protein 2 (CUT1 family) n=1 Tax=Ilumatobacter fluminis TaxID=467091 RepID=A0A4R7I576_9ACTN|nr:carbohydrate ABC transporter permease [Ilumatobacter fluminis]TDT17896.1 carbohydrate ABC transporter membrane protein 2 (CUT1 family) [Ilumatobacter fluminis]